MIMICIMNDDLYGIKGPANMRMPIRGALVDEAGANCAARPVRQARGVI